MPVRQSIYDLCIEAVDPIHGALISGPTRSADFELILDRLPRWASEPTQQLEPYTVCSEITEDTSTLRLARVQGQEQFRVSYSDGTTFALDLRTRQIWATWQPPFVVEDVATYLLGPVLGFALHLRGVVCLHASAIAIGQQAILLVGVGGAGKSTTAAAFVQQGYNVITEDVAALDERDGRVWVRPGYPRIRLWPESVEALYGCPDALPLLTPNWEKRYLDLTTRGFQRAALPVTAVYVLEDRSADPAAPFVTPLAPQAALLTLLSNTYTAHIHDPQMRAREFQILGRLVRTTSMSRVVAHSDLARIPQLCHAILADLPPVELAA